MSTHHPVYCPRSSIVGYDAEKGRAEGILAAHGQRHPSLVILSLPSSGFVYGQCTFRREQDDIGLDGRDRFQGVGDRQTGPD